MTLIRRTFSLLVACSLVACSNATEPKRPNAVVTVQTPALAATVTSGASVTWLQFTVPLTIRNAGSEAFTFYMCASRVEVRSGDTWSAAWAPICTAGSSSPNDILPGESRTFSVLVMAAMEGPGGPDWTASGIDGSYRFVAGLIVPGVGGLIPTVASNEFTLSDAK
jgi:hypothetical protein